MKKLYILFLFCLTFCFHLSFKAQVVTHTLDYTGYAQTFTIPICVNQLTITCYGAQGGAGYASPNGANGGLGGFGARVSAIYYAMPGTTLEVNVGGSPTNTLGGFNGGGNGSLGNSGAGGGASDVRFGGSALSDRIIVAAGGGGGGNAGCTSNTVSGGAGGFGGGGNGTNGVVSIGGGPGLGAIGTAGGAAGAGCILGAAGTAGTLGIGGNGGLGTSICTTTVSGGGGGGGYYGGGGGGGGSAGTPSCFYNDQGGGGGGAGGTNYFAPALTATVVSSAIHLGHGRVVIAYSPLPFNPGISASSLSVCAGSTTSLTVNGATNYTWSTGNNSSTLAVSPTVTSVYSATVFVPQQSVTCTGYSSISIQAVSPPTISVNSGTLCFNSTFTMTPSGASTYTFQGGNAVVNPTSNASYTVVGTSSAGCVSQTFATSNLTVVAPPTISVNSGSICPGTTFTMNPSGASTYTYQGGSATVSPSSASTYTVIGTSSVGCVSQAFATSSVSLLPIPFISVNSGTICQGQSYTINPSGAISYTYIPSGPVVSPMATTIYSVIGSNSLGCVSIVHAASEVKVLDAPLVTLNSGTICTGNTFTFMPSGAISYTLEGGSIYVSPSVTTSYSITGTNIFGCESVSPTIATVSVIPAAPVVIAGPSTICAGQTLTLTVTGADSYLWNTGNIGPIIFVTPATTTVYSTVGTSVANGCSVLAQLNVLVEPCTSIEDNASGYLKNLSVYPNPFNDTFYIELANDLEKNISVSDVTGKVVLEQHSLESKQNVSLQQFPSGLYFVTVTIGNTSRTVKIIKR